MANRRPKTPAQLKAECDAWNAKHPIGTPVTVRLDNGDRCITTTRSAAEVLSGHSAVIWINGISGCYLLDRVTVDAQP